jgi:hypothetical protein
MSIKRVMPDLVSDSLESLLAERPISTWDQLAYDPENPPRKPGIYAWWFRATLPRVPIEGTLVRPEGRLLYIGISPKAPNRNGRPPSAQHLRHRIRYHYRGNAEGSTLRLTLGCLLADDLGLVLRVVGSGKRMTFGEGEETLTGWMSGNALVSWLEHSEPWRVEEHAIRSLCLPLNLDQNSHCAFHSGLTELRRDAKAKARAAWQRRV